MYSKMPHHFLFLFCFILLSVGVNAVTTTCPPSVYPVTCHIFNATIDHYNFRPTTVPHYSMRYVGWDGQYFSAKGPSTFSYANPNSLNCLSSCLILFTLCGLPGTVMTRIFSHISLGRVFFSRWGRKLWTVLLVLRIATKKVQDRRRCQNLILKFISVD